MSAGSCEGVVATVIYTSGIGGGTGAAFYGDSEGNPTVSGYADSFTSGGVSGFAAAGCGLSIFVLCGTALGAFAFNGTIGGVSADAGLLTF
jgi:hypothetical protein